MEIRLRQEWYRQCQCLAYYHHSVSPSPMIAILFFTAMHYFFSPFVLQCIKTTWLFTVWLQFASFSLPEFPTSDRRSSISSPDFPWTHRRASMSTLLFWSSHQTDTISTLVAKSCHRTFTKTFPTSRKSILRLEIRLFKTPKPNLHASTSTLWTLCWCRQMSMTLPVFS